MAKKQTCDITGNRFGKLIVLGKGESKGPGRSSWNCLCDCGNHKTIRGDTLKSGRVKSCGGCGSRKRIPDHLIVMVPVSIRELHCRANAQGLGFGQYIAREYAKCVLGGA